MPSNRGRLLLLRAWAAARAAAEEEEEGRCCRLNDEEAEEEALAVGAGSGAAAAAERSRGMCCFAYVCSPAVAVAVECGVVGWVGEGRMIAEWSVSGFEHSVRRGTCPGATARHGGVGSIHAHAHGGGFTAVITTLGAGVGTGFAAWWGRACARALGARA